MLDQEELNKKHAVDGFASPKELWFGLFQQRMLGVAGSTPQSEQLLTQILDAVCQDPSLDSIPFNPGTWARGEFGRGDIGQEVEGGGGEGACRNKGTR